MKEKDEFKNIISRICWTGNDINRMMVNFFKMLSAYESAYPFNLFLTDGDRNGEGDSEIENEG